MIDWTQIIGYLTAPFAAAVAWVFARRQRRNDAVRSMQATIDLLAEKNAALHALVEQMRTEHAEELARLSDQMRQVSEENEGLKRGQEEMIKKINRLQAELEKERNKKQKPKTKEQ